MGCKGKDRISGFFDPPPSPLKDTLWVEGLVHIGDGGGGWLIKLDKYCLQQTKINFNDKKILENYSYSHSILIFLFDYFYGLG
jgi:hypothetical protein